MNRAPPEPRRASNPRQSSTDAADTEDFLFHLYRGSELLQENHVHEAKEELEAALRLQPLDVKGQDLLAVVYFRLGLYPRAIRIFEELVQAYPNERTPRTNLALCYLKTGQPMNALGLLEQTVATHPTCQRAWAYLGLVYERLGEFARARDSFRHAGQEGMAKRMEDLLEHSPAPASSMSVRLSEPFSDLDVPGGDTRTGSDPLPGTRGRSAGSTLSPPSLGAARPVPTSRSSGSVSPITTAELSAFVRDQLSSLAALPSSLQLSTRSMICRLDAVGATMEASVGSAQTVSWSAPEFLAGRSHRPTYRWALLKGYSYLVLLARKGGYLVTIALNNQRFCFCSQSLVGFESSLTLTAASRIVGGPHLLQTEGTGKLVLFFPSGMRAFDVRASETLSCPTGLVFGWTGSIRSTVPDKKDDDFNNDTGSFSGEGVVLLDLAGPERLSRFLFFFFYLHCGGEKLEIFSGTGERKNQRSINNTATNPHQVNFAQVIKS